VHSLVCNAPQLLAADSKVLAGAWQRAQQCARRRLAWTEELAAAGPTLVTCVLDCRQHQLMMLQYAAETGDLRSKSMLHILADMSYVDFLGVCPGFRAWRSIAPGRWRSVAAGAGGTGSLDGARSAVSSFQPQVSHSRPAANESVHQQQQQQQQQQQHGLILAADALNQPVLVRIGALNAYDRLF